MCTKQFTDCSKRGGYDRKDKCNHTCNDKFAVRLQNLAVIDGSVFKMGDVDNYDGGVIAFAPTGKNLVEFDKTTNHAGGTVVFMGGLQNMNLY